MGVVFLGSGPFTGPELIESSENRKRPEYLLEDHSAVSEINLGFFFTNKSCTDDVRIFLGGFVELFEVFLKLLLFTFHHIFQLALKFVFILLFLLFSNFPISVSLHFGDN